MDSSLPSGEKMGVGFNKDGHISGPCSRPSKQNKKPHDNKINLLPIHTQSKYKSNDSPLTKPARFANKPTLAVKRGSVDTFEFAELLDRFLSTRQWSEGRKRNWGYACSHWLEIIKPSTPIIEVTSFDIESLYVNRHKDFGPHWANLERSLFRLFWKWLAGHGLVLEKTVNTWPVSKVKPKENFQILKREEEDLLCSQLPLPISLYVKLACRTALRRGTIYQLRKNNLINGVLNISADIVKQGRQLIIPLSTSLIESIKSAWTTNDGDLIENLPHPNCVNKIIRNAAKKVGISFEHLTTTQLRCTALDRLLSLGVQLDKAMKFFGWSTQSIVYRHYLSILQLDEAKQLMERL